MFHQVLNVLMVEHIMINFFLQIRQNINSGKMLMNINKLFTLIIIIICFSGCKKKKIIDYENINISNSISNNQISEWCSLQSLFNNLKDKENDEKQSFLYKEMVGKRIDADSYYGYTVSVFKQFEEIGQVRISSDEDLIIIWYERYIGKDEKSFIYICEEVEFLSFPTSWDNILITNINNHTKHFRNDFDPIGIKVFNSNGILVSNQIYNADYVVFFDLESGKIKISDNIEGYKIHNGE